MLRNKFTTVLTKSQSPISDEVVIQKTTKLPRAYSARNEGSGGGFTFTWIFCLLFALSHISSTDLFGKEVKEKKEKPEKKEGEEIKKVDNDALDIKKRDHEYFSNRPFFKLPPIRVPIIQNGVWVADLFCRLDCEIQNNDDYLEVPRIFYTLVDAAYTTLYTTLGERFLVKTPLDVEVWRPLLKRAIEYYIPIKNLYFRQFCLVEYRGTPPTSKLSTH